MNVAANAVCAKTAKMRRAVVALGLGVLFALPLSAPSGATAHPAPQLGSVSRTSLAETSKYAIGSSIAAKKLSRLEMISATVGVGVAPITTYSGRLIRALFVRTSDAAANWTVSNAFPRGVGYPWFTAFETPSEGYAVGSGGTVFTDNGGATWESVTVTGAPDGLAIAGNIVWIDAQKGRRCATSQCVSVLNAYRMGSLMPSSVTKLPNEGATLTEVGPGVGFAIGSGNFSGDIFFTTDSGAAWRSVANPCQSAGISGSAVSSSTAIFIFCVPGNPASSIKDELYGTTDAGVSWSLLSASPGSGLTSAASGNGQFLWTFTGDGRLEVGADRGRHWVYRRSVLEGPGGYFATFGSADAWWPDIGHGVYRTLDGVHWQLIP